MKQIKGQDDLSRANSSLALDLIRISGGLTRRQLEAATGLSWGGVTNTVNRLMSAGYIIERKDTESTGSGRTPCVLEINGDDNLVLGVDVNDTGLTACIMGMNSKVHCEYSGKTDFSSPDALIRCLTAFVEEVLSMHSDRRFLAVGISMQGEVDGVRGVSVRLPQCPGWENVPLKEILEEKFDRSVVIGHDPDCMLLSEMEEADEENVVLMRLDKSVGLAAALRGDILYGSGLWEAAHMIIDPNGPKCCCGARGCLDAYVSACHAGEAADETALHALERPLAVAMHNLICLFRPETFILCGDLMKCRDVFYDGVLNELAGIGDEKRIPDIRPVADAKAAMRGAALLGIKYAVGHIEL